MNLKTNIFSLGPRKKSDTKNGMTAITSIIFISSYRNFIFSGDPASLKQTYSIKRNLIITTCLMKYSSVNQAMETVSTIAKPGFSTGFPLASFSYTDQGEV